MTAASEGSLPDMDRVGRLDRVRAAIEAEGIEALWITKPVNVRWLTGFVASNAAVLVRADELVVATDGRYRSQVADDLERAGLSKSAETVVAPTLDDTLRRIGGATLGIEAEHLTVAHLDEIVEQTGRRPVATSGLLERLRQVKDDAEVARLAAAAAIADCALAEVFADLEPGETERSVARRLENSMADQGAEDRSYPTIVAAGPNAALPHAHPSDRPIAAGDLLVVDVGAKVDGYGSDMTRTVVVGAEPTPEQRRWWDAVCEAQAAGVALVRAGLETIELDRCCRDVLARHDLAERFIHGTGHGIGLEIHEQPIVSARSVDILPAGLVVTVEPGVYVPGVGGVRIEDSVVVTDEGCRPITHSPKTITPVP